MKLGTSHLVHGGEVDYGANKTVEIDKVKYSGRISIRRIGAAEYQVYMTPWYINGGIMRPLSRSREKFPRAEIILFEDRDLAKAVEYANSISGGTDVVEPECGVLAFIKCRNPEDQEEVKSVIDDMVLNRRESWCREES